MRQDLIQRGVKLILEGMGVNLEDQNYKDTPGRVYRFYRELFEKKPLDLPTFEEATDEMVVLRGHRTWGLCPHHLLPVEYTVSVGYLPTGQVVGLSKLARIVEASLTGPLLQESLAINVVDKLQTLKPLGSGCVVVGAHGCMRTRGIKTSGDVVTSAMRGVFLDKPEVRAEFFNLIKGV
jgi:GTP cyclohydrolase I